LGRPGNRLEAVEVVAIDADRQPIELLELHQLAHIARVEDGEIRIEAIAGDFSPALEKAELVEDVAIHEHVAGAGRELEVPVAERDCLLDTGLEQRVRHRDLGALLLAIGAEPAIQVAEAGGLDMENAA